MIPPVPILRYHSVSDDVPGAAAPYAVGRRQFSAQLDALVDLGFTTLTIGELLLARASGLPLPDRTAVITFDDGFADFVSNAWPELVERGLTATLYATAGRLGGTSTWLAPHGAGELPMMTRRQLVGLAAEGCEIGAHSMTHAELDYLPRSVAAWEIGRSKRVLEHLLGRPVDSFAYPHGSYDPAVRQLVIDAGFRSAAAIRNTLSPAGDDWFALARVTVTADFDLERLTDAVTAPRSLMNRSRRRLGDQLWRQAQRFHPWRTDGRVGA
jgi:peptidoglycan/xylan/chitin deacetylase (PgdA/CDA1 family)